MTTDSIVNDSGHKSDHAASAPTQLFEALNEVLRLGVLMIRSGGTAFRARHSMRIVSRRLGFDSLMAHISLSSIVGTGRLGEHCVTSVVEVGTPGVNTRRLHALEELAHAIPEKGSLAELSRKLTAIEQLPHQYSLSLIAIAVGVSCGAFALLNGGTTLEVLAATIGGTLGQGLRSFLFRHRINQFAVTAVCALCASGTYCLVATIALRAGLGVSRHTIGFMSSVLFLFPGFPLIAGLLDLLQYEMSASVMRIAYVLMLLLSVALGLSVIIAMVGLTVERPLAVEWRVELFFLRVLASFVAGAGFAVLFNCSPRTVLHVGLLAIVGNAVRLGLREASVGLPLATFAGSFAVGFGASIGRKWLNGPRIALTVPGVILMVPGLYAFDTLVLFGQGDILAALQAVVLVVFVIGAMAMGLAAARFVTETKWLQM